MLFRSDGSAIAVFRNLTNKGQVSFLADVFQRKYNRDLSEYLNFLSDDNRALLADILNALPNR